jgi:hypothetical protein
VPGLELIGHKGSEAVMRARRGAVIAAVCGTALMAGCLALARFEFGTVYAEMTAPANGSAMTAAAAEITPVDGVKGEDAVKGEEPAKREDAGPSGDAAIIKAALPVSGSSPVAVPMPATAAEPVATIATPDPEPARAQQAAAPDDCILSQSCIDQYLWSIYERTPKQDTIKVSERVKVTVKSKGKTRTITKTVSKLVDEDFTWKDPKAAEKAGMPLKEYVIGGMDPSFKLKLYRACRAMDDAGLVPGITSAFRDDYRQALASGKKAATDRSYHGGSFRGGYGHGLAADMVSAKGETRAERWITSEILWKWIDAHGQEYGVGRPYLDRDPPHVGPIDGKEYADKRGRAKTKLAQAHKRAASAPGNNGSETKDAKTASR